MSSASARGDRHEPEGDIGHRFGQDPADPEHHGPTEGRVVRQTRDELTRARHHGCEEYGDLAVFGSCRGEQFVRRNPHGRVVRESEAHETSFRLVRDGRAAQLGNDREADLLRGLRRFVRTRHGPLVEHGYAMGREQLLGIRL